MIRDINNIKDDICSAKRIIKERLYSDPDIIETLHNPNLDTSEPDSDLDVNIFDYIRVPGSTTEVKNFICFDIRQDDVLATNSYMKQQVYIFSVFSHEDDIKTPYGISRHDLLSYLIRDIFSYSNIFGTQLVEISNVPGILDSYYSNRTIKFEAITPNSPNKAVLTNLHEFKYKRT